MGVHRNDRALWADAELLAAAHAGDGEAFAAFYRRHLAEVLAYLRRETGDRELAADLAAEVFAAVLLSAGLPALEREAVRWRVVDELGYDQIAAQLGCSAMVVRKRVSRGLRRLRDQLTEVSGA